MSSKIRDDLKVKKLGARLYGSLAFTGKGHATDRAVILGLLGLTPDNSRLRIGPMISLRQG